ncbi:MAG TPA: hypothetical protein VGC76_15635 [Pyrinomonadaceae bacterium]|jgi:hypothetical protein
MNNEEKKESLKKQVLAKLFSICEIRGDFVFDNDLVKQVISEMESEKKFKNPFDVTKVDRRDLLPKIMLKKNFAVIHLGNGAHRFIEGVEHVSHDFEPVQKEFEWKYRKSILNEYNTSESNILSVANNQRILHHFTFGQDRELEDEDVSKRPKTYFPHRTKANLRYNFGEEIEIELYRMQIEIDLTIEFNGTIAVFEAKNGKPDNFSVYQIYHPFLYYQEAKKKVEMNDKIKDIVCVYVVKQKQRDTTKLSLWKYTFDRPNDITSIKFLKSACYNLKKEDE